jgi:hypothetical protein
MTPRHCGRTRDTKAGRRVGPAGRAGGSPRIRRRPRRRPAGPLCLSDHAACRPPRVDGVSAAAAWPRAPAGGSSSPRRRAARARPATIRFSKTRRMTHPRPAGPPCDHVRSRLRGSRGRKWEAARARRLGGRPQSPRLQGFLSAAALRGGGGRFCRARVLAPAPRPTFGVPSVLRGSGPTCRGVRVRRGRSPPPPPPPRRRLGSRAYGGPGDGGVDLTLRRVKSCLCGMLECLSRFRQPEAHLSVAASPNPSRNLKLASVTVTAGPGPGSG